MVPQAGEVGVEGPGAGIEEVRAGVEEGGRSSRGGSGVDRGSVRVGAKRDVGVEGEEEGLRWASGGTLHGLHGEHLPEEHRQP